MKFGKRSLKAASMLLSFKVDFWPKSRAEGSSTDLSIKTCIYVALITFFFHFHFRMGNKANKVEHLTYKPFPIEFLI